MSTENKYTPHVHAEAIKAWADGKTIQGRHGPGFDWFDVPNPKWNPNWEYRVKPEVVVDYTAVFGSGYPGINFFPNLDKVKIFYVNSLDGHQGYCKRTTIDGKVVALEFIPKDAK